MKIEFELVDVYEDGALVTIEGDDWIVAIPATLDDPKAIIDTGELENPYGLIDWRKPVEG